MDWYLYTWFFILSKITSNFWHSRDGTTIIPATTAKIIVYQIELFQIVEIKNLIDKNCLNIGYLCHALSHLFVDVDDDSIEEENEVVLAGLDITLPPPAIAVATAIAE